MPQNSPFGLVVVCTVVDDFLIACDRDQRHIETIKDRRLKSIWKLTHGGRTYIKWFLNNMKFSRDRLNGVVMKVDQSSYTELKLREYGLDNDPALKLPIRPNMKPTKQVHGTR